jgi:Methyl-coenzyme M reductase operon protein C
MYRVLLFNGGIYKFDQMQEYLEDVGGILVREDRLQITRGSSFLSEEVRVMLIVPLKEVENVKSLANEIKGEIEVLEIDPNLKNEFLSIISIYNILSLTNNWLNLEEIEELMECPCQSNICREDEQCTFNEIRNTLEKMSTLKILDIKELNGVQEFRIAQKEKII